MLAVDNKRGKEGRGGRPGKTSLNSVGGSRTAIIMIRADPVTHGSDELEYPSLTRHVRCQPPDVIGKLGIPSSCKDA